jgi:hypothetical protein
MVTKYLYIEGTRHRSNGDLREAFSVLLQKSDKLKNKLPRIKMSESQLATIDEFNTSNNYSYALVDLDKNEIERDNVLKSFECDKEKKKSIYFMIQECEAWFLSQPEILDEYYKVDFSKEYKNKTIQNLPNPSDEIPNFLARKTTNKDYHKVRDGATLLKKLNIEKLQQDFSDVKKLLTALSN